MATNKLELHANHSVLPELQPWTERTTWLSSRDTLLYVTPRSKHRCDNCGTVSRGDALLPIKDIAQRLTPGSVVPSGECPECYALCYPVNNRRRKRERAEAKAHDRPRT